MCVVMYIRRRNDVELNNKVINDSESRRFPSRMVKIKNISFFI